MGIVLKILFLPLAVVLMAVVSLLAALEDYTDVVEKNWDLSLPRSAGEVYSADSGASFQGDGYRYHVLEYADSGELAEVLVRETQELPPSPPRYRRSWTPCPSRRTSGPISTTAAALPSPTRWMTGTEATCS